MLIVVMYCWGGMLSPFCCDCLVFFDLMNDVCVLCVLFGCFCVLYV